jgi:hypothetical protein
MPRSEGFAVAATAVISIASPAGYRLICQDWAPRVRVVAMAKAGQNLKEL